MRSNLSFNCENISTGGKTVTQDGTSMMALLGLDAGSLLFPTHTSGNYDHKKEDFKIVSTVSF